MYSTTRATSPSPRAATKACVARSISVQRVWIAARSAKSAAWGIERDTRVFLGTLDDARLGQTIAYTNFQGERWAYPLWQQMIHQVNHATQHRSEAAMLLTKHGHSPGLLDYLYFIDVEAAGST